MITVQPIDQLNVLEGSNATFSITAAGATIYQWEKDDMKIVDTAEHIFGASGNTLMIIGVNNPDDEGSYKVVVSNPSSSVTSNVVMLTISSGKLLCRNVH